MTHFCTTSDRNYLAKALTMYLSLEAYVKEDFVLWWLCIDDETFLILEKLVHERGYKIKPIPIDDLLKQDVDLHRSRQNPASKYGTEYSQFCWTLTPYFTWWLLTYRIPLNAWLYYADADLLFYGNPLFLEERADRMAYSVAIHSHRNSTRAEYDSKTNDSGYFNVGLLLFKNDDSGKSVAQWWKSMMLTTAHQYYAQYGTCGDQKYLDLFEELFGKHRILVWDEDPAGKTAHGAPWNFPNYIFGELPTHVQFRNHAPETILFNHFSHFNADFKNNTWHSSNNGEWKPEEHHQAVRWFYQDYFEKMKGAYELINPRKA